MMFTFSSVRPLAPHCSSRRAIHRLLVIDSGAACVAEAASANYIAQLIYVSLIKTRR